MTSRDEPKDANATPKRRSLFDPTFALCFGAVMSFVALADENGIVWQSQFWDSESPLLKAVGTFVIAFVAGFIPVYILQIIVGTFMRSSR
jgi:hypothetical protein